MPLIDETHYDVYLHICYGTTALAQELASAMAQELVPALAQELAQELDVCGYVCGQPVVLVLDVSGYVCGQPVELVLDVCGYVELELVLDVCGQPVVLVLDVCGQPVELVLELELVLVQEPCFLLHDVTSSNRCQFYSCPHFLKCNLFVLPSL